MGATLRQFLMAGSLVYLVFFMTGCRDIEAVNGEVPEEFMETARNYLGDYEGEFNGFRGVFNVALDGRKLIATYSNEFGQDILHPDCKSEIGQLLRVNGKKKNKKPILQKAVFSFYANLCNQDFQGKELVIYIKSTEEGVRLTLNIERWGRWRETCTYYPDRPVPRVPHGMNSTNNLNAWMGNLESQNDLAPLGYHCNRYYDSEVERGTFYKR